MYSKTRFNSSWIVFLILFTCLFFLARRTARRPSGAWRTSRSLVTAIVLVASSGITCDNRSRFTCFHTVFLPKVISAYDQSTENAETSDGHALWNITYYVRSRSILNQFLTSDLNLMQPCSFIEYSIQEVLSHAVRTPDSRKRAWKHKNRSLDRTRILNCDA